MSVYPEEYFTNTKPNHYNNDTPSPLKGVPPFPRHDELYRLAPRLETGFAKALSSPPRSSSPQLNQQPKSPKMDLPSPTTMRSQHNFSRKSSLQDLWSTAYTVSGKVLEGFDFVGEKIADFMGITTPRYQMYVQEFYERKEEEEGDEEMRAGNEGANVVIRDMPERMDAPMVVIPVQSQHAAQMV